MGASSSRSSSARKEYDVFISFRGEDTRYNFTSHLVEALRSKSIRVYVDYELKKGDEISSSLIKAIHDSYGSLIVFSENYASSKWCLNELLQIFECSKQGHFVIPVFYNTDPSCVRKQAASYGQAFATHVQDPMNKEKLESWKAALTEAANIAGWDTQSLTNRDESELIKNIVNDIVQRMGRIYQPSQYQPTQSSFVGIDKYCEEVELLLQRTPLVGIWGMGGVGKTTIAKVIFDKLSSQYDSFCFFENVREEFERNGSNYIRNKLLSELLEDKNFLCSTTKSPALNFAMGRLRNKRVLIVLDDVSSFEQLEKMRQECNCLGEDSKIIITTRDRHVVVSLEVDHEIYEVGGLNFENSLELFRLNAFNKKNLEIGYEEIVSKFVDYARGNPLALKVLGKYLFSKSKEVWESELAKLNKIPYGKIEKVLRLSYDGLDYSEQQIFLDIACFLKGDHIENVINLLDSFEFYGCSGMKNLQDKALVTILSDERVHMHDLLQEMGQNIVRKESIKYPGSRSRLWDLEEVYDVLTNDKGTDAIEGIMLDLSKIKDLPLKSNTFKKMTNVRFVKFYSSFGKSCKVDLPKSFVLPSKQLSYLCWDKYPLPSLPQNLCAEKLVELRLPYSNITKLWDGQQDIVNLKKINLVKCTKLMELPNFPKESKLESVNLSGCLNLCHIHPSLFNDTLVRLDVHGCKKLTSLGSDRHLKSLKVVRTYYCSSLKEFTLSSDKIDELEFVGTAIEPLPTSIGRCINLKNLRFFGRNKSEFRPLKFLHINGAKESDSSVLPISFDALQCLEVLYLCCWDKLFQLPDNIGMLSSLKQLFLYESSVESLPKSIKHLSCLEYLNVNTCHRLRSLPELPPSIKELSAKNCSALETLIPSTSLQRCDLRNCVKLDEQLFSCIIACARHRIKQEGPTRGFLPGDRGLWLFPYQTRETKIRIVLPPRSDLLGFVFGVYFCHESEPSAEECVRCECYLEYGDTKKCLIARCIEPNFSCYAWTPNDVYLWIYKCDSFEANSSVSFQFYSMQDLYKMSGGERMRSKEEGMIKWCGVWPIYASELELESGDNAKRN